MYENDIYSNSNDNYTGQFSGASNNYPNYQTSASSSGLDNNTDGNKKKKKLGFLKKAALSITLGVLFGSFAGAGFYGVREGVQYLTGANKQVESASAGSGSVQIPEMGGKIITEGNNDLSASNLSKSKAGTVEYISSDVSAVVESVMPAMVAIVNNYTETTSDFFGRTYSEDVSAGGSGIIVSRNDDELLIVSNCHVVSDANSLEVTFIDGTTATAKVKGTDSDMDLAVIAVDTSELSNDTKAAITVATLGDSDDLKMGEPVIAIGNALGYGQSVTTGIVSALNREVTFSDGSSNTFIQTDAAINPGNSGGALLNVNGEVIGINSAKIGETRVEGMCYAIPITSASPIISDLMERETRDKVDEKDMGYIGINLQEVTSQISKTFNMPVGIYVVDTVKDGGAYKAGIMKGDIITKFDGTKISSYADLQDILQYYSVGETVPVTVMRAENGEYVAHEVELTLGEKPNENMNQ